MNAIYITILCIICISFIMGLFLIYLGGKDEYKFANYDVREAVSSMKRTANDHRLQSVMLNHHIEKTDPNMDEEII